MSRRLADRLTGCMLGGAVGDALAAPVEFMSLPNIRAQFGSAGVTDYAPGYGRIGAVTDDTQMPLWTADGLLRAECPRESARRGQRARAVCLACEIAALTHGHPTGYRAADLYTRCRDKDTWRRRFRH